MKEKLNITLIQSSIFWEDVDSNLLSFDEKISIISKTDIILLPEMFNTGFCPKSYHLSENMNGKTISWMIKIAKQKACSIAGTLMVSENKSIFNRLIWVNKEGEIFHYDKTHLFSLINEGKYISKGTNRLILDINGWKICPLICYDLRFPVFSRNDIDYDVLIYLANWPVKRIDAWDTLLKARSIENQCYTFGVNRIGFDGNGVNFNGHSKAFDPFGKEVIDSNENKEEILQIDISFYDLKLKRKQMNFLQDRDNFTLQ